MDYLKLTEYYKKLEGTSKRLEKIFIISKLFIDLKTEKNPGAIINLIRGNVFPVWEERKIGVSEKLIIKALSVSTGNSKENIEKLFSKTGDLGIVAEQLIINKKQTTLSSKKLTVDIVYSKIRSLAEMEGAGAVNRKVGIISELLTSSSPLEAKFIIRIILEQLRVGIADGTIRDSIVWCFFSDKLKLKYEQKTNDFSYPKENKKDYELITSKVQHGYDMICDFAEVYIIIKEKGISGLENIKMKAGKPINVMLYQKANNFAEAVEIVSSPFAVEFKYDGFRIQAHCSNGKISLYTRRLENVTKQFPDIIDILKNGVKGDNYILDTECIAIDSKTKKWLPFQSISQRIRRKYDIEKLVKDVPVLVNVFDVISYNNESLLDAPFHRRRHIIEKIVKVIPSKLQPAEQIVTSDVKEAEKFYNTALSLGNEGVMIKSLSAPYKPGSRVGYGVKIKPILETLDLIIIKAETGEGKRVGWLSSYTVACWDNKKEKLLEVGKVSTGLKEKEEEGVTFNKITKLLKPLVEKQSGKEVIVKPKIIIEVAYEEIQKSNEYSSGFALRFPRFIALRFDKPISEISTIKDVEKIYNEQRGKVK